MVRRCIVAAVAVLALAAAPAGATTTVRIQHENPYARGDAGPNRITVSPIDRGRAFEFEDPDGVVAARGCTQVDATHATCPRIPHPTECEGDSCSHAIEAVHVESYAGDDEVRVGYGAAAQGWPASHAIVDAGPGDDFVGGSPIVDYDLSGGPGDDLIDGAGYNDRVNGGGGRDRLYGGPGSDTLDDGDDAGVRDADLTDGGPCAEERCAPAGPVEPGDVEDRVSYERRRGYVTVDLRAAGPVQGEEGEGDTVRNVEGVYGGDAGNHLVAGPGPASLSGGDGEDTLVAADGDGADFVNCDDGIDVAVADRGDEIVDCESVCPRLAGCPRPRIIISGVPKRCVRRTFVATITVSGVRGFRGMIARIDYEKIGETRRRHWRLRVPMEGRRGFAPLELVIKGRRRATITHELNTCRPPRGEASRTRGT